jgi:predicted nucleic acid-binding Zn ribbon protein
MTKICHKNTEKLGIILERYLNRTKIVEGGQYISLKDKISQYSVIQQWAKIVGKNISLHTQPFRIKGGVLFIGVDSGIWANELYLLKDKIIADINKKIGKPIIRDIYFKVMQIEH